MIYFKKLIFSALFLLSGIAVFAQSNGIIEGRVFNSKNNEPISFATIAIYGTSIGSISDLDGKFLFTGIEPGYVELRVTKDAVLSDIFIM